MGVVANDPGHLGGAIDADGRRQGGPLPAAVRRPRPARPVPVRHAGVHGRARGRADRPGAPLQPHVRDRGQPRPCRSSRSCCARATGSGPRPWPAAASGRRCSSWPGPPASSAAWASRARCGSGSAGSSTRSRTRPSGRRCSTSMVELRLRARQGAQRGHRLRDRRRDRPGRLAPADRGDPAVVPAAAAPGRARSGAASTPGERVELGRPGRTWPRFPVVEQPVGEPFTERHDETASAPPVRRALHAVDAAGHHVQAGIDAGRSCPHRHPLGVPSAQVGLAHLEEAGAATRPALPPRRGTAPGWCTGGHRPAT